jgi:hypothetical protein
MSERVLLPALLALAAVGAALAFGLRRPAPAAAPDASNAPEPGMAQPGPLLPAPPPPTEAELRRGLEVDALRSLHFTLQQTFQAGRPSDWPRERVEAALRRLWPGPSPTWKATCRGRVCQVTAHAEPAGRDWRVEMAASPDVQAIADRMAWDPDGADPSAYLLLAQDGASDGSTLLGEVERKLRASPAVRGCLSRAPRAGTLEYALTADDTGVTFRRGGSLLDTDVRPCVEDELATLIAGLTVPPAVKRGTLAITLRAPP